jgi:hypothetical protein
MFPPVSDYLIDQQVTLTLQTWTTSNLYDPDGGRMVQSETVRPEVPAAVLPGRPIREVTIDPETGLRRVTVVQPATVEFTSDVGLHVDDLVTWTDEADETHIYQVCAYGSVAGQPGFWVATCQKRA